MASIAPENEIGNLTFAPTFLTLNSYSQMVDKIPIGGAFINTSHCSFFNYNGCSGFWFDDRICIIQTCFQRKKFNFLHNHFYNDIAIPNYTYTTIHNYGKVWLD